MKSSHWLFFLLKRLVYLWLGVSLLSCAKQEMEFGRPPATGGRADIVFTNGKILTVDQNFSIKEGVAIQNGRFVAVGTAREIRLWTGPRTRVINLGGRTMIPGLIDSHIHATVAGFTWDSELHWEFTRSLSDGLRQIAEAAKNAPEGGWIVVGGGWTPAQFPERRLPTRAELDAIAPKHRVYVQYLRQAAVLNSAALAAVGISRQTPNPAGGEFERDPATGELTGVLQGVSAWEHAYSKIPQPTLDKVRESLRKCFRELNRLGITAVADLQTSGVTFGHRRLLADMARGNALTVRLNYYIAPSGPGDELEQLRRAVEEVKQLSSSDMFHFAGFGETLIRGTGDGDVLSNPKGFTITPEAREKFRQLMRFFAESGYNFHLHTTHDSTARQLLDVIEEVNRSAPFSRQRIIFAHLEDATPETIARIKALGGGISVQDRLALAGERVVELWGEPAARHAPPLRTMINAGVQLGAGTDAFRSGSYSPMLSLWWLTTGKTISGTPIRDPSQNVSREEALRMYTMGSAWLAFDNQRRGSIEVGKFADLAVLNADYLTVPVDQIPSLESLLTMIAGQVVYAAGPFAQLERR